MLLAWAAVLQLAGSVGGARDVPDAGQLALDAQAPQALLHLVQVRGRGCIEVCFETRLVPNGWEAQHTQLVAERMIISRRITTMARTISSCHGPWSFVHSICLSMKPFEGRTSCLFRVDLHRSVSYSDEDDAIRLL